MTLLTLDQSFFALLATVLIAGTARGLSGFGTGMIVAPVAAALYDPVTAVVMLVIMDSLPILPLTIPVLKIVRWREVLPVAAGLALFVPVGIYILKNSDPTLLRWVICVAILVCAAVLWRGWLYRGARSAPVSFSVGALAGTLSGIASIPGPPVLFYWLSSTLPAAVIRANLLALFLLGEFMSIGNLWAAGLLEKERVLMGLTAAPVYLAGLMAGWGLFSLASEQAYRRITFLLIVAAAVLALPAGGSIVRTMVGLAE